MELAFRLKGSLRQKMSSGGSNEFTFRQDVATFVCSFNHFLIWPRQIHEKPKAQKLKLQTFSTVLYVIELEESSFIFNMLRSQESSFDYLLYRTGLSDLLGFFFEILKRLFSKQYQVFPGWYISPQLS